MNAVTSGRMVKCNEKYCSLIPSLKKPNHQRTPTQSGGMFPLDIHSHQSYILLASCAVLCCIALPAMPPDNNQSKLPCHPSQAHALVSIAIAFPIPNAISIQFCS